MSEKYSFVDYLWCQSFSSKKHLIEKHFLKNKPVIPGPWHIMGQFPDPRPHILEFPGLSGIPKPVCELFQALLAAFVLHREISCLHPKCCSPDHTVPLMASHHIGHGSGSKMAQIWPVGTHKIRFYSAIYPILFMFEICWVISQGPHRCYSPTKQGNVWIRASACSG